MKCTPSARSIRKVNGRRMLDSTQSLRGSVKREFRCVARDFLLRTVECALEPAVKAPDAARLVVVHIDRARVALA